MQDQGPENRSGAIGAEAPRRALWAGSAGMVTYAASATVTPICLVIVAREFGLSLTTAGGLEASRSLLLTGMLFASAFLAGRWGKALSLGWASLALGVGMVAYALAPNYGALLIALALAGTGGGVLEALINPLVQEAAPKQSGRWLNVVNAFWSIGVLVTVLSAGEWLTQGGSWRWAVGAVGGLSVGAAALFFVAHGAGGRRGVGGEVVARDLWRVVRTRRFWWFVPMMVLAGATEGAFTFWSASLVQLELGGTPRAGGVATAAFAGGMILGRLVAGAWARQEALPRWIAGSALVGAAASAFVPWTSGWPVLVAVLFVAGLGVACFWPSIQAYAADRLAVDPTALFIWLSVAGIPGFALASWLLGWAGDRWGLRAGFMAVPPLFLALAALMAGERRGPSRGES